MHTVPPLCYEYNNRDRARVEGMQVGLVAWNGPVLETSAPLSIIPVPDLRDLILTCYPGV